MSEARPEPKPSIAGVEQELLDAFAFLENWTDRYQYIIDLGRQLPPFPDAYKNAAKLVRGCQSQVWLHAEIKDGLLHLEAASDAAIVSGLVAILLRLYDDRSPAEILAASPDFIERLGLSQHLSPTRNNGLHAMVQTIRRHAEEALRQAAG